MKKPAFQPWVIRSRFDMGWDRVVAAESFHAFRVVSEQLNMGGTMPAVVDTVVLKQHMPSGEQPHYSNQPETSVQDLISHIRGKALEGGATPEAILLIHNLAPFTDKELNIMAEKLAKKGAAPKADKAASKSKGNPDALKKAREARAEAGPDVRKITITNKENPYREGSNRAASFNALKGAKTVEDYKTAGGKTKYLSRWVDEGRITLS